MCSLSNKSLNVPEATDINDAPNIPEANLPKSIPPILSQKAVRNWKAIISARPTTYTILRPWNSEIGERNMPPVPNPQIYSDIPRTLTSWLIPKCSIILSEARDHAEEIQVTLTLNSEMRITIIHLRTGDMFMGFSLSLPSSNRTHHSLSSYTSFWITS